MTATLGIIGAGNMGRAIISGTIDEGVLTAPDILVAEQDEFRRASAAQLGCNVTDDPKQALNCEQVMIAVKPQSFAELAKAIAPLPRSMVVVSIMAGLSSRPIRKALGEEARVVRVMPNTPCQIGEGMSAIALGDGAQEGDETLTRNIFESIGRCVLLEETLMHSVTAVSGSGPAYVFLLAESMEQAAMQVGLSRTDARLLVGQTILGAARLLTTSGHTADELRQMVTSPGGTTASALEVMFERELPQIVTEAVVAAKDRGEELDQD